MARSTKPTVMLTVKPDTLHAVRAAAAAAGLPAATLITQMLDEMVPMLNGMAEASIAMKEKRVEAFDHLSQSLASANLAGAQLQLGITKLRHKSAKVKRR